MDSIGFIIMLIIYWVFTALAKSAKKRKQQAAGGTAAKPATQPGQPRPAAEPGNEIPEFLRELLGLEDPKKQGPRRERPSTGAEEVEVEAVEEPGEGGPDDETWESRHLEWESEQTSPEIPSAPGLDDELARHQRRLKEQMERANASALKRKSGAYLIASPILGQTTGTVKKRRTRYFRTANELRRAIIMKEVLDTPVSKRRARNPFWGNI